MDVKQKIYFSLGSLFCVVVVTGNLIFQKFVTLNVSTNVFFELSVGVLLYPVTFLLTDIITELFGKESATHVIKTSTVCSFFILFLLMIANNLSATSWSRVDNYTFDLVFGSYGIATLASLLATFISQIIDINIYSFLKKLTNDKHLWLRNNVSTIIAQFIDTTCVLTILSLNGIIPLENLISIGISSFTFKVFAAFLDTPFCYLGCYFGKKVIA